MKTEYRDYDVTVTCLSPACTVASVEVMEIIAATPAKAIQEARKIMRNSGWTKQDGKIEYSAKLA